MASKPDLNLRGARIEPPNNPGTWIGRFWRSKISAILTCLLNPRFIIPVVANTDGIPQNQEALITVGANGWTAKFPALNGPGAGGGTSNGSAQQFLFVQDYGDYITAVPYNGTAATGAAVKIAKPYKIRTSIVSETVNGIAHAYSYALAAGAYTRTDTSTLGVESQKINPPFLTTDLIYAVGFTTNAPASLVGVTLVMLDDGRAWGR